MDSEKHWLKQNKNLLKPARKKKEVIYTLPLASLSQLLASCWRFMFYVDWYECDLYAVLVDGGGTEALRPRWVFLGCEAANYVL